ncbi:PQQ-like beta-propeller repeat protein, partial [Streptomyces sp. T-3]|nr:PQQ-like beta-propeller repeat protein [Streptomyces sp. T-3]
AALALVAVAGGAIVALRPQDGGSTPRSENGGAPEIRTTLTGAAPVGWKPWRVRPLGDMAEGGDLFCTVHRDSMYCAGDTDGPVRRIRLSDGKTMWPTEEPSFDISAPSEHVLGVTDRTVTVVRSTIGEGEEDSTHRVVGLDPKTGKQRWATPLTSTSDTGEAQAGGIVLQAPPGSGPELRALDADSGDRLWTFRPPASLQRDFDGKETDCLPYAAGTRLYAMCVPQSSPEGPSRVYALDGKGGTLWSYDYPNFLDLLAVDGDSPVFTTNAETKNGASQYSIAVHLDARTGKAVEFPVRQPMDSSVSAAGGVLYFARPDGRWNAYSLATGERTWSRLVNHDGLSAPVASGDLLLGATPIGQVVAMDRRSGKELWVTKRHAADGGDGSRDPRVHAVGRILFVEGGGPTLFSFDGAKPPLVE